MVLPVLVGELNEPIEVFHEYFGAVFGFSGDNIIDRHVVRQWLEF